MESVLKGVLQEELERNLQKQSVFSHELSKYKKGSLCVIIIHGDKYLYRKYRLKNKIISEYIGPLDSEQSKEAYKNREQYIKIKQDIKDLKQEEKNLRRAIKIYG